MTVVGHSVVQIGLEFAGSVAGAWIGATVSFYVLFCILWAIALEPGFDACGHGAVFFGVPAGSAIGIYLVEGIILKCRELSSRRIIIAFAVCDVAIVLSRLFPDVVANTFGGHIGLTAIAACSSVLGYNLGGRWNNRE